MCVYFGSELIVDYVNIANCLCAVVYELVVHKEILIHSSTNSCSLSLTLSSPARPLLVT